MALFRKSNGRLTGVIQKRINLERDIQTITEQNLETVFGLQLVASEFQLNNLRIDTLAFDNETKSFVIIEYKKNRAFSVIDQGFAYLSLMLNNKADFILEYNDRLNETLSRDNVDWSQTRVLFVAPSFTTHQQNAINFRDLPIELWEIQEYEGGLLSYNQLIASDNSESIDTISNNQEVEQIAREVKRYTIEDHFRSGWDDMRELYDLLSERLLEIDSRIVVDPKKVYIGFKIDNTVIFDIHTYKSKLVLELYRVEPKDLDDPKRVTEYQKNSHKHYGKHITEYAITDEEQIDYAVMLAKQVYERFNR